MTLSFSIRCANESIHKNVGGQKRDNLSNTFLKIKFMISKTTKPAITNKFNTLKLTSASFDFTKENFYFAAALTVQFALWKS